MVKPEREKQQTGEPSTSDSSSPKYKGVRKRKWGKWVSEIRLPNCRERIWLGSYDSAEKAARAFDAALFCLRGPSAKFNFPENPPSIPEGCTLSPSEIQSVAAQFANSEPGTCNSFRTSSAYSSSSSSEVRVDSPSPSVSDKPGQLGTESALDESLLDLFKTMGPDHSVPSSYDMYPGLDEFPSDFYATPLPTTNYEEEQYDDSYSHHSFLWNF